MATQPKTHLVVAIVNSNDDLVAVIRDELLRAGFNVVTAHIRDIKAGRQDFSVFLESHDPTIVVYDIAVPYEDQWTLFQTLRQLPAAKGRQFVITTVNKKVMEQRVGQTDVIEIQGGHADDLDPVIDAVKRLAKQEI